MVEINKRFKALDGLRGICVLLIACVYHYGIIFESKYRLELGQYLTELMFMVSGYLAFHSYYHKISDGEVSIESFAKKRINRLYPGVVVSLIVMLVGQSIYIHYHGTYWVTDGNDLWHFLLVSLGIHMWIESKPAINGPAWFVSVLVLMDLLFYVSVKMEKRTGKLIMALPIIVGLIIESVGSSYPLINSWISRGMYSFFAGVVLALFGVGGATARFPC